jgi:two-component system response regulator PrrA
MPAPATTTSSVLIVDDDEAVTQTFARMLRLEGFTVRTAANAESGLAEATAERPDAIVLDLRMPLLDGLGFLRSLRATAGLATVPVAIVTGDYFVDEGVSAELQAFGALLTFKPLWFEDLVRLVHGLVKVKS